MRVLICGDRYWSDKDTMRRYMKTLPRDTVIIEGDAHGADTMAGVLAHELGLTLAVYPALWSSYGAAAGPIRNRRMLDALPDEVHAFHNDLESSRGTRNMISQARKRGVPVWLHTSTAEPTRLA